MTTNRRRWRMLPKLGLLTIQCAHWRFLAPDDDDDRVFCCFAILLRFKLYLRKLLLLLLLLLAWHGCRRCSRGKLSACTTTNTYSHFVFMYVAKKPRAESSVVYLVLNTNSKPPPPPSIPTSLLWGTGTVHHPVVLNIDIIEFFCGFIV